MIGMTPSTKTKVKPMPAWVLAIVPKPKGITKTIKSGSEDVERDTMPFILKRIDQTAYQTKKLAAKLKGSNQRESLRNAWNFVKDHIEYVADDPNHEEVRDPSVTIHEGRGDCDCMTVLLGTLLLNMGIKFYPRIIEQWNSGEWTHIYLIVPKPGVSSIKSRSDYTVLDCVIESFDKEPEFSNHKDYKMGLNGLKSLQGTTDKCSKKGPGNLIRYERNQSIEDMGYTPTEKFLQANYIPYTATTDQNNGRQLVIQTPNGTAALPTVISDADAKKLKAMTTEMASVQTMVPALQSDSAQYVEAEVVESDPEPKSATTAGFGWLFGFAILVLGIGIVTSKSSALNGPDPAPTPLPEPKNLGRVKKAKKKKRSVRKLNISLS